jgi:hypothetical protein
MVITPAMALELLKHRPPNRPLSKTRVRAMIDDMRAGRWAINGEPIILTENLALVDGQHRLQACWEAGVPLTTMVIVGVNQAVMPTIDQGTAKTGPDVLRMAQMDHAQTLASAARWLWRYLNQAMRQHAILLRAYQLPAFLAQHPGLPASLEWGHTLRALLPASCASMLYAVMSARDTACAKRFYHALATGLGVTQDDPAYVVRERLLKEPRSRQHGAVVNRAALLVLAWNCTRQGRRMKPGLTWKGLSNASVPFPQML